MIVAGSLALAVIVACILVPAVIIAGSLALAVIVACVLVPAVIIACSLALAVIAGSLALAVIAGSLALAVIAGSLALAVIAGALDQAQVAGVLAHMTTMIPWLTAVRPASVVGIALVPGATVRGCGRRGGQSDDRILLRALHGCRGNVDALRTLVWTFVRADPAQRQHEARGNGHCHGARRGNEFRVVAKRGRNILSDEIHFGGQKPSADALWNLQHAPRSQRGHEPPDGRCSDAFGDQGVQEPGHHGPRHTWLDATERAGGRAIADDDEQCIGCQISNVFE